MTASSNGSEESDHILTLQGITRIKLAYPLPATTIPPLTRHAVSYTDNHPSSPSEKAFIAFRMAALRMLDALSVEGRSTLGVRGLVGSDVGNAAKDKWRKSRKMVEDMSWARAIMVAEALVAATGGTYEDTIGEYRTPAIGITTSNYSTFVIPAQISCRQRIQILAWRKRRRYSTSGQALLRSLPRSHRTLTSRYRSTRKSSTCNFAYHSTFYFTQLTKLLFKRQPSTARRNPA